MKRAVGIDRFAVRRSFELAAGTYDEAAGLAREIADRMLERLDLLKAAPERVLDLGSGTGYCARKLRLRYPGCTVVELDFAVNMLLRSRAQPSWWRRPLARLAGVRASLVCADMERLPFADESFDMVWSNLALNAVEPPDRALAETWRVLRPGGVCMFSTFGPDTLKELRDAYATGDRHAHVNRFPDMHDLGDCLLHCRFADPVMDMECITVTYRDVRTLLSDLRASGARNVNPGRNPALSGKRGFAACLAAYERLREGERLPATFEVVYGQGWKGQLAKPRDERAVIRFQRMRGGGTP